MNRTQSDPQPTNGAVRGRYTDGQPFDAIHYLQAKLLIRPERLSSLERFHDFNKLVQRTAKSLKIDFIDEPDATDRPRTREVIFVDTPDFRLYNNSFILRRRIHYVDGFPVGDPEIVFKFRNSALDRAAALDVRPAIDGKYRIKFKLQALPLVDHIGGCRFLYSHNCQFGLSQVHERDRSTMSTLTRILPALAELKKSKDERVQFVNEGIVEELLLPLGKLDFNKGVVAKSNVSLWRTRADHRPVIGEYSFQVKFNRRSDVPSKVQRLIREFFVTLQHDVEHWISLGTTKTGLVYRLKGRSLRRNE